MRKVRDWASGTTGWRMRQKPRGALTARHRTTKGKKNDKTKEKAIDFYISRKKVGKGHAQRSARRVVQ